MGSIMSIIEDSRMSEVEAANIIKRAMRYNRDRIFNLMIAKGRGNLSKDVLLAIKCVYNYTDDVSMCGATMICDQCLFDYVKTGYVSPGGRVEVSNILNNKTYNNYTSKKILKMVYQAMTLSELKSRTGWTSHTWDEDKYAYPNKYYIDTISNSLFNCKFSIIFFLNLAISISFLGVFWFFFLNPCNNTIDLFL